MLFVGYRFTKEQQVDRIIKVNEESINKNAIISWQIKMAGMKEAIKQVRCFAKFNKI